MHGVIYSVSRSAKNAMANASFVISAMNAIVPATGVNHARSAMAVMVVYKDATHARCATNYATQIV